MKLIKRKNRIVVNMIMTFSNVLYFSLIKGKQKGEKSKKNIKVGIFVIMNGIIKVILKKV